MGFFRKTSPTNWPHCQACGYSMIGNVSGRCPECGATFIPSKDAGPGAPCKRVSAILIVTSLLAVPLGLWLSVPKLHGPGAYAPTRIAKAAVGRSGPIAQALGAYRMDVGRLPTTTEGLRALFARPVIVRAEWDGPYMEGVFAELTDPWGTPFRYASPGIHNVDGYDLWSPGSDGVDNAGLESSDDIANWPR